MRTNPRMKLILPTSLCSLFVVPLSLALTTASVPADEVRLLKVSHDVTWEFYQDFNVAFVAHRKTQTGELHPHGSLRQLDQREEGPLQRLRLVRPDLSEG